MSDLTLKKNDRDFSGVRAAMQRYVDHDILPGVSYAVLQGRDLLDVQCIGWADKERSQILDTDHIFRAMSNTKLVTSCATLMLFDEGHFKLDDPIDRFIPQLANRRVLRPAASSLDDTEPANTLITIRHLLSHRSGLSYGLLDPGTLMYEAYTSRKVINPRLPLSNMIDVLADLPLLFHPGSSWEYSVATDVLGRLVEIVSGRTLDRFFQERIFDPLGMVDTGFTLSPEKHGRLAKCYDGADLLDPMKPGLKPNDSLPWKGAFLHPAPLLLGGGGLATTLPDMVRLIRSLLPNGATLLKPETISMMMQNQLPDGTCIRFARLGDIHGKGYGLGGAVTLTPSSIDPPGSEGEFQWGGLAGTHWWISPNANLAAVLMTQRNMGFWNPFSFEFKRAVYDALTT